MISGCNCFVVSGFCLKRDCALTCQKVILNLLVLVTSHFWVFINLTTDSSIVF